MDKNKSILNVVVFSSIIVQILENTNVKNYKSFKWYNDTDFLSTWLLSLLLFTQTPKIFQFWLLTKVTM